MTMISGGQLAGGVLLTPNLPVGSYRTFGVHVGREQTRPATCDEIGCPAYTLGWTTVLDTSTERGQRAVAFLERGAGGRHYLEVTYPPGSVVRAFWFEPGQRCFEAGEHRIQIKPAVFEQHGGFHNTLATNRRPYDRPDQWVDDFATHQDKLASKAKEG